MDTDDQPIVAGMTAGAPALHTLHGWWDSSSCCIPLAVLCCTWSCQTACTLLRVCSIAVSYDRHVGDRISPYLVSSSLSIQPWCSHTSHGSAGLQEQQVSMCKPAVSVHAQPVSHAGLVSTAASPL